MTEVLRYCCDIVMTAHKNPTPISLKSCAPFTKCITKIYGTTIDGVEDLDLVMPMYNLIECSSSLWYYCKNEATVFNTNIADSNNFKSFK